jgi:hypothetical protein
MTIIDLSPLVPAGFQGPFYRFAGIEAAPARAFALVEGT